MITPQKNRSYRRDTIISYDIFGHISSMLIFNRITMLLRAILETTGNTIGVARV